MMDSDERNIELLIKQLKEGEEIDLRCIAAEKLGNKQDHFDIIIPALVEGLNDDNWLVRVEIAKSLGRLGQNALTAIEPLKKAMNEPRNRAKRGHFYEIITGLEQIKASGPEITPEPVIEEQKIVEEIPEEPIEDKPTEEITERVPEEEVVGEDIEEIVEDIADDLPEDATDDTIIKEAIEEITEEVLEDVIEDSVDDSVDEDVIEDIAKDIAEGIAQEVVELEKKIEEEKEDESLSDSEELEVMEEVLEETIEDTLEDLIEEVVEDSVDEDVIEELAEDIAEKVIDITEEEAEEFIEAPTSDVVEEPVTGEMTEEIVSEEVPLDEVLVFKEDEEEEKKAPSKPIASDDLPAELDVPIKKMVKTLLKVVLVGDEAVGKTTLRKGYCDTGFSSEYKEIIGADFASKQLEVKDEKFVLQVWDIAAKERFRFNKELYFRGLIGALLVFDVSNKESYNNVAKWLVDIVTVENKELALVLVGNKIDLRGNIDLECTSFNDGQELAAKLSTKSGFEIPYIETSALTGAAVEQSFQMLTDRATVIYFKLKDKM
ncbi:MAG: GTP-binding protein [Candidatus Heimdallarchaeota archaeon]